MSLLDKAREEAPPPAPSKDAWYRCLKCGAATKQRKGLPEVAHNCPKTKTMQTMKEET